jgi:hypothetical protein
MGARKHQCVWLIFVHDGEFKIAIERGGGYRLPHDAALEQRGALIQINVPR